MFDDFNWIWDSLFNMNWIWFFNNIWLFNDNWSVNNDWLFHDTVWMGVCMRLYISFMMGNWGNMTNWVCRSKWWVSRSKSWISGSKSWVSGSKSWVAEMAAVATAYKEKLQLSMSIDHGRTAIFSYGKLTWFSCNTYRILLIRNSHSPNRANHVCRASFLWQHRLCLQPSLHLQQKLTQPKGRLRITKWAEE